MWIAKPVQALSNDEKSAWIACHAKWLEQEGEHPLSQTLTWANAAQALGATAFLVFSPGEKIGGIVLRLPSKDPSQGPVLDCVNGPLLDWDRPADAPRQLALFAMACSRAEKKFSKLRIAPRWILGETDGGRLERIPIEPTSVQGAATVQLEIATSAEEQLSGFSPRLRRTFQRNYNSTDRESAWSAAHESPERLTAFAERMRTFGKDRGFAVPSVEWFNALVGYPELARLEGLSFWLASVRSGKARSELLICFHDRHGHYLFGLDEREKDAPGWASPSTLAHELAIKNARESGLTLYDLNGYLENPPSGHPYEAVSLYKKQFQGRIRRYGVPEFVLTAN